MKENLGIFYDKTSDFQQQQFITLCHLIKRSIPEADQLQNLLDIGSGSGARTYECLDIFKGIRRITGIEPDWEMIAVAKEKYSDPRIAFKQMAADSLSQLKTENISYNAVISNWAMHWIPDKEKMMADLNALTTPGAVLMLSTCENLPGLLTMVDEYVRNEFKITPGNSPYFYLNAAAWKDLLARHGWKIRVIETNTLWRDVEDTRQYLEHWFTASTTKFLYGKHLVELSPWAHSDLLWVMNRAFPSEIHKEGLRFSENALFLTAEKL